MLYPKSVTIDEKTIANLTALYQDAYQEITKELTSASSYGVARRRYILSQINQILSSFGTEVNGLIDTQITDAYQTGSDQAVKQLTAISEDIPIKSGFDRIHQTAVAALVDDTQAAFGQSVQGVGRSAKQLLNQAVRDQITKQLAIGKIGGKALKEVKATIVGALQDQGLDSLVDKAGRGWTLDRYSEMLIRTKTVEARNRGLVNRMADNNYDLVQVSAHGATDVCADWEGVILSISGETEGYPTVDEAEGDGLFHPNCEHALNALVPDLAAVTNAYNPNIDTLTGADFVDQVDTKYKGLTAPSNQVVGTKTPAK